MSKFFTISIGSNGLIVLLNSRSKIYENYFFENIESEENKNKILDLFKKNKKLPIYIILDNIGQNYNLKKFPNVSFFDLRKIVDRKFKYGIPEDDLKDKIFLGYNKTEREWSYMFISSPVDGILKDLIDLIEETENILNGIYMLPLESENILKKIKKKLKVKKNKALKNTFSWDIILVENEVSGFREMTFVNNRLIFTRILNEDTSSQEHFNTQFKDNISRTTEYLKRFYVNFNEKDLNVYTIINNDTKVLVDVLNKENSLNIKSFSYTEFSRLFGLVKKTNKFLNYGDILFEELIMFNKKIISFSTKNMKQLAIMSSLSSIFYKFVILLFFVLFIIFGVGIFNFTRNKYKLNKALADLELSKNKLEAKKKLEFGDGVLNIDEIIDTTSFYVLVKELYKDPFNSISKFSSSINDNVLVTNLKWKINSRRGILNGGSEVINLDSSLLNKSGKIDDLFKIYEAIDISLKSNLLNFNINMSSLPRNINFNTSYFSFPLKIDIVEK